MLILNTAVDEISTDLLVLKYRFFVVYEAISDIMVVSEVQDNLYSREFYRHSETLFSGTLKLCTKAFQVLTEIETDGSLVTQVAVSEQIEVVKKIIYDFDEEVAALEGLVEIPTNDKEAAATFMKAGKNIIRILNDITKTMFGVSLDDFIAEFVENKDKYRRLSVDMLMQDKIDKAIAYNLLGHSPQA